MTPVDVPFGGADQFTPSSVKYWEEALLAAEKRGTKVRALMLCNPHNPLGQCYPKGTIIALMKLCSKYQLHLLCDEIYAASVYQVPDKHAEPFTSALSFDHIPYISPDYVHVYYGMSKDFAAGGLRLGCMVIRNKQLMRAMSAITQFHWSGGPGEVIATTILEDEKWLENFLKLGRERLSDRNVLTRKLLEDMGVAYHPGANAGFFIWCDMRPFLPSMKEASKILEKDATSEWDRERALSAKMTLNKVYMTEGEGFKSEDPGWFRIIFSQDERVLKTGLKRVGEVIGR